MEKILTNEEKAVGISLQVRDLCVEKGVTRDNAETASLLVQQAALQMAYWKDDYYYKVITEIVGAAYNSCEDHSEIDEVLKKYKL